jgi:hypothetical protein
MRIRTPHALLAAAALAAGAVVVVPAIAQDLPETRIVSTAKATPDKAGTAKHPQGISISASAKLIVAPDFEPPIVTGVEILVGKGLVWNSDKYAKCSKEVLDRHGPKGCPRTSIVGSATATGKADTVAARLDVVLINGGGNRKYAYATLNNPARVRETIPIESSRPHDGTWDHREAFSVPRSLQIVAGVPLQLTALKMEIAGKPYAKDYITSTSCPSGGWKYQVTAHYLYDGTGRTADDVSAGSIPCTK